MRFMQRLCGQADYGSPLTSKSSRLRAIESPWRRTSCIQRGRQTTVRQTQPQVVWAPKGDFVTAPHSTRTAVTSCAVAEATTRTNTLKCGSATVSFNGAASSSATHAVRGLRCLPANKGETNEELTARTCSAQDQLNEEDINTCMVSWNCDRHWNKLLEFFKALICTPESMSCFLESKCLTLVVSCKVWTTMGTVSLTCVRLYNRECVLRVKS